MRIIHVITGLNNGGAEAVLYRLCTYDELAEHIVVSLMDEGKYGPLLREAGIKVHCLNMPQGRVTIHGLVKLFRLMRNLKPDVVQTWMYHANLVGGLVARLVGCRGVVWGIHNGKLKPGTAKRFTIMVNKACALLSKWVPARIVVCAEQASRIHVEMGYAAGKMIVIANGYDFSHFQPNGILGRERRSEWGGLEQKTLIGMVARFDPEKDHANLFAALGLVKVCGIEFSCILVGAGMDSTNKPLVRLISAADLEENVYLLGQRNDIPVVMSAIDLHVLSSISEAFPNVLAEAMACGTPCVTTDVGDAALIVGDTGWVVPPADAVQLADAIKSALMARHNTKGWQIRCDAARMRVVEHFGLEKMIVAYHTVWGNENEK